MPAICDREFKYHISDVLGDDLLARRVCKFTLSVKEDKIYCFGSCTSGYDIVIFRAAPAGPGTALMREVLDVIRNLAWP